MEFAPLIYIRESVSYSVYPSVIRASVIRCYRLDRIRDCSHCGRMRYDDDRDCYG
tara:strand:- start:105 stop:269 length:165 start_codon:yes stop_codon:yes gene_type:complete